MHIDHQSKQEIRPFQNVKKTVIYKFYTSTFIIYWSERLRTVHGSLGNLGPLTKDNSLLHHLIQMRSTSRSSSKSSTLVRSCLLSSIQCTKIYYYSNIFSKKMIFFFVKLYKKCNACKSKFFCLCIVIFPPWF